MFLSENLNLLDTAVFDWCLLKRIETLNIDIESKVEERVWKGVGRGDMWNVRCETWCVRWDVKMWDVKIDIGVLLCIDACLRWRYYIKCVISSHRPHTTWLSDFQDISHMCEVKNELKLCQHIMPAYFAIIMKKPNANCASRLFHPSARWKCWNQWAEGSTS